MYMYIVLFNCLLSYRPQYTLTRISKDFATPRLITPGERNRIASITHRLTLGMFCRSSSVIWWCLSVIYEKAVFIRDVSNPGIKSTERSSTETNFVDTYRYFIMDHILLVLPANVTTFVYCHYLATCISYIKQANRSFKNSFVPD